ncbi:MAG: hypothetical protein ACLUIQ_05845 [Dialister invisus]
MSLTWAVFEILGTVAFAFSGATVGLARGWMFSHCALSVDAEAVFSAMCWRAYFRLYRADRMGSCCGGSGVHRFPEGTETCPFAYRVSDTAGLPHAVTGG